MDKSRPQWLEVPISRTCLTDEEIESVLEPIRDGWLVQGKKVAEFEDIWSGFTNVEHSVAVTSCTSGLSLVLAALGINPGDEVIVPALTWVSTANVVENLGAVVVFADINYETFNIDTDRIESLINARTVGIIPVHLFGLPADMKAISRIAEKHSLWVLEDAACGFGARIGMKHVGSFGEAGVFSFHPRKAITTGEGGMVTTSSSELASKMRRLRNHGADTTDLQRHLGPKPYLLADHPEAGFNLRMTDIQAALGVSQMRRGEKIAAERRLIAQNYKFIIDRLDWLRAPIEPEGYVHGYQSYPCVFEPEATERAIRERDWLAIKELNRKRNEMMDYFQSKGISTRPATHAVHTLQYYAERYGLRAEDNPVAWAMGECSVSLPLYHGMSEDEFSCVERALGEFRD